MDEAIDADGECTGYIVAGMAGGGSTYLHKNRDSSTWREGVALIQPDDGFKYLVIQHDVGVASHGHGMTALSGINEKGVAGATFGASTSEPRPSAPWVPSAACRLALQNAASSSAYVARFKDVVEKHGIPAGISGAVSPDEGWRIEYAGHVWATDGPYIHDYSTIANTYTITSMKPLDAGGWRRQGRLRKAREILERGLYPDVPGSSWFRQWDIDKAFAFARNQEPPESPFGEIPSTFGVGAHSGSVLGGSDPRPICDELPYGLAGRCVSAHIAVPDGENPEFLSVLWWSLDRPTLAPFIPLFIGITEVPEAIAVGGGPDAPFPASDLFDRLRRVAHQREGSGDLIRREWRAFEVRQHQRMAVRLVPDVRAHLAAGRLEDAHHDLDHFLRLQVDEVMDIASELVDDLTERHTRVRGRS